MQSPVFEKNSQKVLKSLFKIAKKYKYILKFFNQFWFTPIIRLILSDFKGENVLGREFHENDENFLRLLNKQSWELKVMKIRKSKCRGNLKSRSA